MVAQTVLNEGALGRIVEEEVRGLVGRLAQSRSADEAEGMAQAWSRRLGRLVLEEGLQAQVARQEQQASRTCGCGGSYQVHSRRVRTVLTLLGSVRLVRAYLRCAQCGERGFPAEAWLGWKGAFSDRLEEAVAHEVAGLPYRQALAGLKKLLGVELSVAGAQAIVARWGEQKLVCQPNAEPVAGRLVVEIDGTTAHLERWREVKVGTFMEWENERYRRKSYAAEWASVEEFAAPLWEEALWRGASLAREVAVLGDGASMVWTLSEHLFPRATQILDWYHLTEHLWAAGRVLEPPGTEALARRIGRWKGALWEGRSEGVQEELWELARRGRDDADETLRKTAQYLDTHQVRTRYPQFRAAGWPIGSGVVEGACKELIDLRFKRKSTRWKLPGARAVLHLRLDRFNDRWETRREHMRQAA